MNIKTTIEQVEADYYRPPHKKTRLVRVLRWVENHFNEFSFIRFETADVLSATGMMATVKVAVFAHQGNEVFAHSFVTDGGSIVEATIRQLEFDGLPISPLPFSSIGFWQLCFRELADNTLMDSINLSKGEI